MGLREKLNENPAITTGATILIIVIAVGFIIYSQIPSGGNKVATEAFFSIDDGQTYFADDAQKLAPFEKDGKQAVRVHVYQCGKDKPFVAYMERFTPEAKKQLEAAMAKGPAQSPEQGAQISMLMQNGVEYKKPNGGKWMRMMDDYQAFGNMMNITCPDPNVAPDRLDP